MPVTHDVTHEDGSRSILLQTPCGFEIALLRTKTGGFRMNAHFNGHPVSVSNSHYQLSNDGAREFSNGMTKLFGETP